MNNHAMNVLEFNKIVESVKQYAVTGQARMLFDSLRPSADIELIKAWMGETTQARAMIDRNASVPLASLENIQKIFDKFGKGIVLTPEDLESCKNLLESVKRLKKYMLSMKFIAPDVASYAQSMFELDELYSDINRCISNGSVDDRATPELGKIRKKIIIAEERIKQKLNSILTSSAYSTMLQEPVISIRHGRYAVPIKKEFRKSFDGSVLDISSTGSTVFIEPAGISRLQEELNTLKIEEENEVYKVLSYLTGIVEGYSGELSINVEAIVHYDFIFAKAKFGKANNCKAVMLNTQFKAIIKNARHPLLGNAAVPLDFDIGEGYKALIITGPNTGGKTVAIKTVGLLTMMVQSGLHVPVDDGSEFAVFSDILADIGDGQSIEQSLSTFSSHVKNISTIVKCADNSTLVIMDELGAGTDPGEGMGYAIAVLEYVFGRGATIIATTHFSEIKEFAGKTPGFKNGCMEFDINTLKPLYKLSIGKPGDSNAFLIALKLGFDKSIIERAHQITYGKYMEFTPGILTDTKALVDDNTLADHMEALKKLKNNSLEKEKQERRSKYSRKDFKVGDCVYISNMKRTGIVCEPENDKGETVVMVMKKKIRINSKRLTLYIESKELYPEDYDYDIIFESKENRKKRHDLNRKHVDGLVIEHKPDEQ